MLTGRERQSWYDDFYARTDFVHYPEAVDAAFLSAVFAFAGVSRGSRVLDLGCGTGVQLARMQALGMRMTGADYSREAVRRTAARSRHAGVVQADARSLPIRSGALDAAIAIGCSLVNTDDLASIPLMFEEAMRVVRPGGCVIATTVTNLSGGELGGWRQHDRGALQRIARALPGSRRAMRMCMPGLARVNAALPLSPLADLVLRLPLHVARTVVFFAWK